MKNFLRHLRLDTERAEPGKICQNQQTWQTSIVAPQGTHHVNRMDGRALYRQRYDEVLPFHAPGLAPARLGDEAFHIVPNGSAAYSRRFARTFGFYDNLAAVVSAGDWFHIRPDGQRAYNETWNWCGNFQQGRCAVRDARGHYYHIRENGARLPAGPHRYAGDFREGAAVIRNMDGLCRHINREGQFIHGEKFFDLDVFHKGLARARDAHGWFHITREGRDASCGRRYLCLEPFYNGQALATMPNGERVVIDENGEVQVALNTSADEYRARLHDSSVSPWSPLAMRLGILLGLAGGEAALTCAPQNLDIVQRAWVGLGLLNSDRQLTRLGACLAPGTVERERILYWTGPQFTPWVEAEQRIQSTVPRNFFAEHAGDTETTALIQRVLDSYATEDWAGISAFLQLPSDATVIDVGGGQGALLSELSAHCGRKILVDLPNTAGARQNGKALIKRQPPPGHLCDSPPQNDIEFVGINFLAEPLPQGDVYLFSRVLHDWPDQQAMHILAGIPAGAMVVVIDREDDAGRHGLLSLNMLLTNGSRERSAEEWDTLFNACDLCLQRRVAWKGHAIMQLTKRN